MFHATQTALLCSLAATSFVTERLSVTDPDAMNAETIVVDRTSSRGAGECGGGLSDLPPDMPGWPLKLATWRPTDGGVFVQADEDADLEVLFSSARSTKRVFLMNPDGTHLPGWPITLPTGNFARWGVSFGDLDGDGLGEVVATSDNQPNGSIGWTHAYHTDGSIVQGFPALTQGDHLRPPTVVDLDGDLRCEIIVSERHPGGAGSKLYVIGGDGVTLPGWPYVLNHFPAASAAAGDLDGDGIKEVIFPTYTSLYAIKLQGPAPIPGFPYTPDDGSVFAHSSPVLADVTGDGVPEIAVGTQHSGPSYGSVHLIGPRGRSLPGWPIDVEYHVSAPATFADLDDDGALEIICGENRQSLCPLGSVYAWHADGSPAPGFPFSSTHAVQSQVAVGDIDGDGVAELIWDDSLTSDGFGWLSGCHSDGSPIDGWPLKFFGTPVFNTVALSDIDGDGDVEMLCPVGNPGEEGATIYLWDTPGIASSIQMPMYQYGPGRDGLVAPLAPVPVNPWGPQTSITPLEFGLSAHPNPFNPQVTIRYALVGRSETRFQIYDMSGKVLRQFAAGSAVAGSLTWDGRDDQDRPLASGVYLLRAMSHQAVTTLRLSLVR